jgi:hypothetical protein
MKSHFRNWLVLGAALNNFFCTSIGLAGTPANKAAAPDWVITAITYNYTEVSPEELAQAKEEAGRIVLETGVGIKWLDCPLEGTNTLGTFLNPQQTPDSLNLYVKILSRSMAERYNFTAAQFGFALPSPEDHFGSAYVFYHRAKELAEFRFGDGRETLGQVLSYRLPGRAMILGHLMAHEIGHLLLGRDSHCRKGIMSVPWGRLTVARAASGKLLFTPKEVNRIRANVQERKRAAQQHEE